MVVPRAVSGAVEFCVGDTVVTIEHATEQLQQLLPLCDGHRTIAEIAESSGCSEKLTAELIQTLSARGIIEDCTRAYRLFHKYSSNGGSFFHRLSNDEVLEIMARQKWAPDIEGEESVKLEPTSLVLEGHIHKRRSSFPSVPAIKADFQAISSVVNAMCGIVREGRRSVPSAGALGGVSVHLILRNECPPLHSGIWWYDPEKRVFQPLRREVSGSKDLFMRAELTDQLLENGAAILFISADLDGASSKYANRGYRYALLETGAVMQNAYLAAAELGVPIRAVGGFFDESVQSFLGEPESVVPLLGLLLGG